MMEKVKILVACHKPGEVYHDDVYIPMHVGRAVSKFKDEMADMLGDDTGDNISEKNAKYCELTAQYWAWKNLHDVEHTDVVLNVVLCNVREMLPCTNLYQTLNTIYLTDSKQDYTA